MKKSEAASQLAKRIRATWPELDQVSPHHCHHIITWLEQIGMSPPVRYIYYTSEGKEVPGSYEYGTALYSWEDESET